MTDARWLTLHQVDYSPSSRIATLKGFCIGAAVIVEWLIIAAVICVTLEWG
jgi:hypothetical protein